MNPGTRLLYNFFFNVFFLLSAPFYILKMRRRGNWRIGLRQRFGHYGSKIKQSVTNSHVLWMHAVSVGEVNICTHLIRALEPRLPTYKIVVSTTTSTGMEELQRKLPSHVIKIYYPLDRYKSVRRALHSIRPQAIVLVEAEIWPNFLWRAHQSQIPTFLVNARLSERSFRGYRRFRLLFRPLFASFIGVGCQNQQDAERLRLLGCRAEAVHIVGNLKFDAAKIGERRLLDVPSLLLRLGVSQGATLLVAGSTHPGEEAILGRVFLRLRAVFPNLFMIVVPRHFERGKEAGQELAQAGVKFAYRSELTSQSQFKPGELECLLVNTTGELKFFYEHAAVIFVGKSLTSEGGQNPIEPGALAKPIVFGPHMQNFAAIAAELVARKGAVQVSNEAELEQAFSEILADRKWATTLGQNAALVVSENLGAVERTVEMILKELPEANPYTSAGNRTAK